MLVAFKESATMARCSSFSEVNDDAEARLQATAQEGQILLEESRQLREELAEAQSRSRRAAKISQIALVERMDEEAKNASGAVERLRAKVDGQEGALTALHLQGDAARRRTERLEREVAEFRSRVAAVALELEREVVDSNEYEASSATTSLVEQETRQLRAELHELEEMTREQQRKGEALEEEAQQISKKLLRTQALTQNAEKKLEESPGRQDADEAADIIEQAEALVSALQAKIEAEAAEREALEREAAGSTSREPSFDPKEAARQTVRQGNWSSLGDQLRMVDRVGHERVPDADESALRSELEEERLAVEELFAELSSLQEEEKKRKKEKSKVSRKKTSALDADAPDQSMRREIETLRVARAKRDNIRLDIKNCEWELREAQDDLDKARCCLRQVLSGREARGSTKRVSLFGT
eukprot:gnl/TRDRNA2_/TRDRNA2_45256_c0_seq1.p1 gnl/TRDRNA2_/TRDRNA2_45256_c0~~gnl/TRDRNA2_/TRDRNA2_45256_c0_seq1.p1  ORF type:complete len:415 (+),score=119.75 gnl/TRDRNA2_/TRDRNA2_45256_c0_seq1:115-1359(+)